MVNVVTPIWYLSQPCPVCGQGSALVLVACPQCEHVAAECTEEESCFADARRLDANSQGDSPSLLCPACHAAPLEKSCLRRLNKFKQRDSAARRTRRASSETSHSVKYWTRVQADKRG